MSTTFSRRCILRTSLAVAAGAGLGQVAAAYDTPAAATSRGDDHPAPSLPDVPGMLGDRRANEFWYQLDEVFLYRPSPEVRDAVMAIFAAGGERDLYRMWLDLVTSPAYPGNFIAMMAPVREQLRLVSELELALFDSFYHRHDPRLTRLFADFGQGLLYDPRRLADGQPVHTMDGDPPAAYHFWHVLLRAKMVLGIDRERWREMAPRVGFAWAVQSFARPSNVEANQPLPHDAVRRLAASWLPRTPQRLDADFQSFPYPPGITGEPATVPEVPQDRAGVGQEDVERP